MSWLAQNEHIIRLGCFVCLFLLMLSWETWRPARFINAQIPDLLNWRRRLTNIGLSALNSILIRILPALSAVAVAQTVSTHEFGLLPSLTLPFWAQCLATILFLDCCIYWQHRLFHAVPWLWRLHRVHHSDEHIDTTTAIRFHPIEIVLSMFIKVAIVTLLGAPVEAVIIFEILLNGGALFNHANIRLAPGLEQRLRVVIVTPDMHRVHHSIHTAEMNQNFGFSFSVWDRLFGSYQAQPRDGHEEMRIGLPELRGLRARRLNQLLKQPFH